MNIANDNQNENSSKVVVSNQFSKKHNDLPIVSFVLGLISLIFCWVIFIPIITSIIGLITGCTSLIKKYNNSTIAIFGIIFSIISLLISIFILGLAIIGTIIS